MRKISLGFLLVFFSLFMTSCTRETVDESKINIVTSFYPMYVATANIVEGVEDIELKNLTASTTGCLHDYQITTSDMIKLSHADALVINGDGMESFIEKAISTYPKLNIINASQGIRENFIHEEEHEHKEHIHEHEEHEHEENSHYWVSISLYMEQIKNIKDAIIIICPNSKEKIEKNTKEYLSKLEELRTKMHDALDVIENKKVVTFHEAFEFFADEFDLDVVAVIEREPGTYPSSKDVAEIIDLIKEKDVKAIFVEPQYSRSAADTISRETGVSVYNLDPVVTGDLNKDAYIEIMDNNLKNLQEAFSK